jgi:uncharacterized coiled-coil protein SlyX
MRRYKRLFEETKEELNAKIEKARLEIKQQQISLENLDTSKQGAFDRKSSIADTIAKQKEIISTAQEKLRTLGKEEK